MADENLDICVQFVQILSKFGGLEPRPKPLVLQRFSAPTWQQEPNFWTAVLVLSKFCPNFWGPGNLEKEGW